MHKRIVIVSLVILSLTVQVYSVNAQVTGSVYSIFGIGEFVENGFGMNRSMGGTGIAFQSEWSMNYLNPAGYLGLPPSSLNLELGVYAVYNNSQMRSSIQSYRDINFSYSSVNLYGTDWWAFSFGILPFSNSEYKIQSTDVISGSLDTYKKTFQGSGGFSRVYIGNSFNVYGGFAAGLNLSYIDGSITEIESAAGSNSLADYELVNERSGGTAYLDYGVQYSLVDRDWSYTLGLIYGGSKIINMADHLQLTSQGDTTFLEQDTRSNMKIPQKFGLGIAAKTTTFKAGFDYKWENWSTAEISNPLVRLKDSNRYSIGVEYSPSVANRGSPNISYRLGANYRDSHLRIENASINGWGASLGVGIPFDRMFTNLSVEYGQEGTLSRGLIKNNYWMVYLSVSLFEFWYPLPPEE